MLYLKERKQPTRRRLAHSLQKSPRAPLPRRSRRSWSSRVRRRLLLQRNVCPAADDQHQNNAQSPLLTNPEMAAGSSVSFGFQRGAKQLNKCH